MALLMSAPLSATITEFDAAQALGLAVDPRGLAAPIPGRIEINAAPDGSQALMSAIAPNDPLTYTGIRAEIDWIAEAAHAGGAAAERWYVWDVFFPAGFAPAEQISFMQIHDSPDDGESPVKYPNFEFMVQGDQVYCTVPINAPSEASSNGRFLPGVRQRAVTGRWVTCALHTNWASNATGYVDVYYDGVLMGREWGRACAYADAVGPYWKLGLYDFTHGGIAQTYRAWYRNARVYSDGHTAHEALGAAPRNPRQPLVYPAALA
jgi:hypothetical protein